MGRALRSGVPVFAEKVIVYSLYKNGESQVQKHLLYIVFLLGYLFVIGNTGHIRIDLLFGDFDFIASLNLPL